MSGRARRAKSSDERFAEIVRQLDDQYQNYSESVLILSGLRDFFASQASPAKFVGTDLPLRRLDALEQQQPPRPDLVTQSYDDKTGFCFELKWSISEDPQKLKKEVVDTSRYSQPRSGWKTEDGTISKVEAFLIAPREDCARIIAASRSRNEISDILERNLTLLSWDFSRTSGPERLYVLKVGGMTSSLDSHFSGAGLDLGASTMTDSPAKILFYGAKPPLVYTMEKVYYLANAVKVFDTLTDVEIRLRASRYCREGILTSAKELYTEQARYFPPWERADQEVPQVRQTWIQEALVGLARINLAIPVVSLRPLTGSGAVFLKATRRGWENNRSQLFFVPSRGRGFALRNQIVQSYARFQLHQEELRA